MKKNAIAAVITCLLVMAVFYTNNLVGNRNNKDELTVGFVCMGDESVPYSDNFMDVETDIRQKYGDKVKVLYKCNVSQKTESKAIEELIEEKCDMIIFDSSIFSEISKEYAGKYPDVEFCQATGNNANEEPVLKNYHNYMGRIYEGRYVSGIVAGMKLKEMIDTDLIRPDQAKIGYVGAYPYPEVISGFTAFFLGVRSIVPEATMEVGYVGSWNNYFKEEKMAEEMIEDDCVIISQHSDTIGPAMACERAINDHVVYHVGYNASMTEVAPTTSLVSTKINWSEYILSAIDAVMNGKKIESEIDGVTKGQDSWAGFDKNWVQILDLNKAIIAPGTKEAVVNAINSLEQKEINVFMGDYTGVNPNDPEDTIDLKDGFTENKDSSSPVFSYILDDVIQIRDDFCKIQ